MKDNAQLAKEFIASLGRGAIADDLVAPELVCWAGSSSTQFGLAHLRQMIALLAQLFPAGLSIEPSGEPLIDGDRGSLMARSHGVLSNGEVYENEYHYAFRFREGRIIEMREYMDTALVARVIGPAIQSLLEKNAAK